MEAKPKTHYRKVSLDDEAVNELHSLAHLASVKEDRRVSLSEALWFGCQVAKEILDKDQEISDDC